MNKSITLKGFMLLCLNLYNALWIAVHLRANEPNLVICIAEYVGIGFSILLNVGMLNEIYRT